MKKIVSTLGELAKIGGFELPAGANAATEITALCDDPKTAAPRALTFIDVKLPGEIYACNAAAIIVPPEAMNLIPRNEGLILIPHTAPGEAFAPLEKAFE